MTTEAVENLIDLLQQLEEEVNEADTRASAESVELEVGDVGEVSLDDLLGESVALAQAKRAKQLGRKLSEGQKTVLSDFAIQQHEAAWEPQAVVAHFRETECSCGELVRSFSGWYLYERHRRQVGSIRLSRFAGLIPQELPRFSHTSQHTTGECVCCLAVPTPANLVDFPALSELGMADSAASSQGELF